MFWHIVGLVAGFVLAIILGTAAFLLWAMPYDWQKGFRRAVLPLSGFGWVVWYFFLRR